VQPGHTGFGLRIARSSVTTLLDVLLSKTAGVEQHGRHHGLRCET
jgi:hypothetical protein